MSKLNQTVILPRGLESRLPSTLFGTLEIIAWAAVMLVLVASIFVDADNHYVVQSVPALAKPFAESGLALLRGLPLP